MNFSHGDQVARLRAAAFLACVVFFLDGAQASLAGTYTVTGILHTPMGGNPLANDVPAEYIRVIVMDDDLLFDDELGTGYSGTIGEFSITFSESGDADLSNGIQPVTSIWSYDDDSKIR